MKKTSNTKFLVNVGVFSAIAFVLQFLGSSTGIKVAGFLEVEFSDIPPLILTFFYGPLAGVLSELVKNLLHSAMTQTGFVGELANFVINGTMCFAVGMIYKYKRTLVGAVVSLAVGAIVMSLAGILANLYIMLPLYMPTAPFAEKLSLALTVILPFNIAKGVVISVITFLLYKRVCKLIVL